MNTMTDSKNLAAKAGPRAVVTGRRTMPPSEAFVETLVAQGVTEVFGIVGSAYMDALDLFPLAGIRFISVAHEQGGGHMADGYSRVSGRHGVCIAQNGPGITNFVTSIAAAYWAHSPVVVITPEMGSMTLRSEEHTSELQSPCNLVCRLLLETTISCPSASAAARRSRSACATSDCTPMTSRSRRTGKRSSTAPPAHSSFVTSSLRRSPS